MAAIHMEGPDLGSKRLNSSRDATGRGRDHEAFPEGQRPAEASRKPSRSERRAAERTAQAEATLAQTEQQIHDLADEVRRDLKGSA